MKRYLLFCGCAYQPNGGWHDLHDRFSTIDGAKPAFADIRDDWAHIVDAETGLIVLEWIGDDEWREPGA